MKNLLIGIVASLIASLIAGFLSNALFGSVGGSIETNVIFKVYSLFLAFAVFIASLMFAIKVNPDLLKKLDKLDEYRLSGFLNSTLAWFWVVLLLISIITFAMFFFIKTS